MREIYGAQLTNKLDVPAALDTLQADANTQIVSIIEVDTLKVLIIVKKLA